MDIEKLISELNKAYKPITKKEIQQMAEKVKASPEMIVLEKEIEQGQAFLRVLNSLGM